MIKEGTHVQVNMGKVRYGYAALCEALPGLENKTGTVTKIRDKVSASIFECTVTFEDGTSNEFDIEELIDLDDEKLKAAYATVKEHLSEIAMYRKQAEAGRRLYKFMDEWFKKYPSESKPVRALDKYMKDAGIE